jgi:hypothetical protein
MIIKHEYICSFNVWHGNKSLSSEIVLSLPINGIWLLHLEAYYESKSLLENTGVVMVTDGNLDRQLLLHSKYGNMSVCRLHDDRYRYSCNFSCDSNFCIPPGLLVVTITIKCTWSQLEETRKIDHVLKGIISQAEEFLDRPGGSGCIAGWKEMNHDNDATTVT